MATARVAGGQPERWVVNGRVIRFLDPCAPEEGWAGAEAKLPARRLGGLLGAIRHPRGHGGAA
jgi:hypothetical protein